MVAIMYSMDPLVAAAITERHLSGSGHQHLVCWSASVLVPMKSRVGRETTDAYCVAKYGPKWVSTRTAVTHLFSKM
ncbi:protein QUIRKY-like [Gossypium australe]|uniref:Protein QUIRKY-like n=1 Tax=Gossypium australe TaxID=47621 RepID=A0A5B6VJU1_9ROSI|nr:protein QUIRKY-like [Gossypium australe]